MTDEKDLNKPDMPEENSPDEVQQQVADEAVDPGADESAALEAGGETPENVEKVVNEDDASEDDAEAAMLAMLEDLPSDADKAELSDIAFSSENPSSVSKVEFQHLSEPSGTPQIKNIDMLMDVNLPITIELGRTKMSISDILALGPGSVVELNKLAGEPVELLVNQRSVAKGEVVVIDENFGVRITQLLTPEERLRALGEES